ncbi:MAG: M48 family metallopeptidase [Planctomycetota bacterium]
MKKSETIHIDGLGPVLVRKNKRAKRLSITVKYDRTVRVTVPEKVSFEEACGFLAAKTGWARKHLDRLGRLEQDGGRQCLPPVNRAEARAVLTARLNHLAQEHGFEYNRAFIRDQKTRWGSCSSANNINLNMRLLGLPQELADYVILHELVHTRFRNHGAGFWAELDRLVPDGKRLRRQLNEYGLRTF